MDRNSVIGLLLIGLILMVFTYVNKPEREALEQQKAQEQLAGKKEDSLIVRSDTIQNQAFTAMYGPLAPAASGVDSFYFLTNDRMRMRISAKGGYIDQVQLIGYNTWAKDSLILFKPDSTKFFVSIPFENRYISTGDLYFTPEKQGEVRVSGKDSVTYTLIAAGIDGKALIYTYKLHGDSYLQDRRLLQMKPPEFHRKRYSDH